MFKAFISLRMHRAKSFLVESLCGLVVSGGVFRKSTQYVP